jgi:hypothetical protein
MGAARESGLSRSGSNHFRGSQEELGGSFRFRSRANHTAVSNAMMIGLNRSLYNSRLLLGARLALPPV